MIKVDDLRNVKGIGPKAIERVREYLEELKGDEAYVSKYDSDIHISPGDLVQGDMLEAMNGIPDSSIDMILTDLPYGTTACSWDSVIDFDKMWKQYNRVIKPSGAIVLFGSEPFSSRLRSSNVDNYKYDWVWEKHRANNFMTARRQPLKQHEVISVFSKGANNYFPQKYPVLEIEDIVKVYEKEGKSALNDIFKDKEYYRFGKIDRRKTVNHPTSNVEVTGIEVTRTRRRDDGTRYPNSILKFENAKQPTSHPTQKPVALLEYLIKTYTNRGETVLDSTMGSGSTGVAATNVGRQFIGIELDEDYFEIAKKRIDVAKENAE